MDRTSNKFYDAADEVIRVPSAKDVNLTHDPEIFMKKLDELQSPTERLSLLFRSAFHPREDPTHESLWIRTSFFCGAAGGLIFGGILNSPDIHETYMRRHNASVFEGKYRGNRHFWDTLIVGCASRGLKYAFRTSLLAGSATSICFGSITYRNRLYLPDWMVGFTTLGALSRLWIGSRGVAAGALFGAIAGLFGFALAKASELTSGLSVAQLRYLNHTDWLEKRQAALRRQQIDAERLHMEFISKQNSGED